MQAESSVVTQVLCACCVVQQLKVQKWGFSSGSCALVPSKDLFCLNASCSYRRAMPLLSSLDERRELKLLPPARFARTGGTCECLAAGGAGSRKAGLCQGWAREKGDSATGVLHLKQK